MCVWCKYFAVGISDGKERESYFGKLGVCHLLLVYLLYLVNEGMNEWVNERINESVNKVINYWINEVMNDWVNEVINDWVNK